MKSPSALSALAAAVALAAWPQSAGAVKLRRQQEQQSQQDVADAPGTMKEVVSLLQGMLDKSKTEAESDRKLYAEYKCYCDDNEEEKSESIKTLTKQIGLLENEVAELQASNGALSLESAKLKADMDSNEQARNDADALRTKENGAFITEEADLQAAIGQLEQAIQVLADIGADQSLASSAHDEFMAGYKDKETKLLKLKQSVKQALVAASSFLTPAQNQKIEAFLQLDVPISGAYVSQAGGVVGILKGMKETFDTNLKSAQDAEKAAAEAHTKWMDTKKSEFDTMSGSYNKKQGTLGDNDGELATKTGALDDSRTQKDEDTAFLESLTEMCDKKAKEYDQRVEFRQNEDAAISEAIAILNSDHAFGAFDKVAATSTGATSFLQLRSLRRRVAGRAAIRATLDDRRTRAVARATIHEAAMTTADSRLARIAGLLALGNPFNVVLEEIDKVKDLLDKEAEQDAKQKKWCEDENTIMNGNLDTKKTDISALETAITDLENTIDHPETGLKKMLADDETTLEENAKSQKDETEVRRQENMNYKETERNCMSAIALLKKATSVLKRYYQKQEEKLQEELGLAQQDPAPPSTWEGPFEGQSTKGKEIISMLEFIQSESEKEANTAHQTELDAQHAYEDSMQALKDEEKLTMESLANYKKELAEKKSELEQKHVELEETIEEKRAIERYLEKIKPGCDWITENFDTRESNRGTEKAALDKTIDLLKKTPAFQKAEAEAEERKLGECKNVCNGDAEHAECKACIAKVSVPGYCAGHPSARGC